MSTTLQSSAKIEEPKECSELQETESEAKTKESENRTSEDSEYETIDTKRYEVQKRTDNLVNTSDVTEQSVRIRQKIGKL